MTRVAEVFRNKKPLIVYITAGDPDLATTEKIILELEKRGVDIIELGVPFSDPLADGPVIQASHSRALKAGATFTKIMAMIARVRKKTDIPIILMGAYNLFTNYGLEKFGKDALRCKVDGVVIPDLPPEEANIMIELGRSKHFAVIFLASLTSTSERLKLISESSSGFIYLVAVKGVTGTRTGMDKELFTTIERLKGMTSRPIAVGFGISSPEQAKAILKKADGIILGSSFITYYNQSPVKGFRFISSLVKGISNA